MNSPLDLVCQKVILTAGHHLCLLLLERGCGRSIRVTTFSLVCHCLKLASLRVSIQASVACNLKLLRLQQLLLLLLHQQQGVRLHRIELLCIALTETLHIHRRQRFAIASCFAPLLEVLQASEGLLDIAYSKPSAHLFGGIHTLLNLLQTGPVGVVTELVLSFGAVVSLRFT